MSDNTYAKPRIGLNRSNFLEWHREWQLSLPSYGLAGEEVMKLKETIEFLHKPTLGDTMWILTEESGEEKWTEIKMTPYHRKQLPSRLSSWKNDFDKYKRSKGLLISNLINSIDESIRITLMNQPSYNEIIANLQSIKLWNLITLVMQSQGSSQQDLINEWNNLRQYDNINGSIIDLNKHINKFEQIYMNINPLTSGISDRRKAEQLVKSLHFQRYQAIIGPWIILVDTPDNPLNPFPTYNEVKDRIMKYDQVLKKSESENNNSDYTLSAFSLHKKVKSHQSFSPNPITCLNCCKRGHVRQECFSKPVKCDIPGCRQWHPTQLHDKLASKTHSMSKFEDRKSDKSASFSTSMRYSQNKSTNHGFNHNAQHTSSTAQPKPERKFSQKQKNYVAKKPTNVKEKFMNPNQKRVFFTYTDEFGNNLSNKVYEEIEETEKNTSNGYVDKDEDEDNEEM
jgi:hypothetical protein